jgi:hypothetical protein
MTQPPEQPNQPGQPGPPPYPPQQQGGAPGYPPPPSAPPQQPYQQPGSYPPPPPQPYSGFTPPATAPKNGLGIWALVLAIIGLLLSFSVGGGILLGLVAIILGFIGRGRVKRGEATNGGVAMAGILLGLLAIIAGIAFIFIYLTVFNEVGGTDFVDCMNNAGSDSTAQQACADEFQQNIEDRFSITLTPTPTP